MMPITGLDLISVEILHAAADIALPAKLAGGGIVARDGGLRLAAGETALGNENAAVADNRTAFEHRPGRCGSFGGHLPAFEFAAHIELQIQANQISVVGVACPSLAGGAEGLAT